MHRVIAQLRLKVINEALNSTCSSGRKGAGLCRGIGPWLQTTLLVDCSVIGSYGPTDSHELVYASGCIGGPVSHQSMRNRKTLKTLNGRFHAPVGRRHHRVRSVPIVPTRADATSRWSETGPWGT